VCVCVCVCTGGLSGEDVKAVKAAVIEALNEEKSVSKSLSKLAANLVPPLMKACHLESIVQEEVTAWTPKGVKGDVKVEQFDWPQQDEKKDTPAAAAHFVKQLRGFGVKIIFGDEGKSREGKEATWRVFDVHSNLRLFESRFGSYLLKGNTDLIIGPRMVAPEGAALQARVIIDLKLDTNIKMGDVAGQWIGELLCACAVSMHPLLVVFTDLKTRFSP